jgi:uncharacterized membrane protein YedE/YeeE
MSIIVAFVSGFIMSMGLIISGMVNPQKVIGFLDVFGHFDPTLAFVMAGALIVAAVGYCLAGRSKPLLCEAFDLPKKKKIDMPLIAGAAIFGIGWGLAGFCPGPAIVGVGLGFHKAIIFVFFMLIGMFLAKRMVSAK